MPEQRIGVGNAADDPTAMAAVEQIITLMRMGVAPLLNRNLDHLPELQSYQITAAAIYAGLCLGHMIALGSAKESDVARAQKLVIINFRNGVKNGKAEALKAMEAEGNA